MKNKRIGYTILLFGFLNVSTVLSQNNPRILEIRQLYKDYNNNLSGMDNYEIKYNTPGTYPSLTFYTDNSGKLLVKASDEDEFGSQASEYYFKNDTIQFIFSKEERLINHWGTDTVRFRKNEVRFYFDKGKVIKTLKREYTGIEGKDEKVKLSDLPNIETDYLSDKDANWTYFREMIPKLSDLYNSLEKTF
jgi:hypothetical protein